MKKILFAIALAVVATACSTDNNDNLTAQVGTIAINASTRGEVDENNTSTDSGFTLANTPQADDLRVEIVGNGNTYSWSTLADFNKAVEEGLTFASAPYTITLSYGEKGTEGWSKPYFEGTTSIDVPGYGLTTIADVEVILTNSIIAISSTDNFNGYLSEASYTVNGVAWEEAKGEHLFMNAGDVEIVCTAKRPTGKSITLKQTVTLKPTTRHTVVFDLSTAGNATVTISFDDEIVATEEFEFELNENA